MTNAQKLARYLERQKITLRQFSAQIGSDYGTIGRYIREERLPRIDAAIKIQDATGGYVKIRDWVRASGEGN